MTITLACPCGHQIIVGTEGPLQRVRCPKCQTLVEVPVPNSPVPEAAAFQLQTIWTCPVCKRDWNAGTSLCVECGFDFRTGKKINTTYQLRDRHVDVGYTYLGIYTRFAVQRSKKGRRSLVMKSWFLWIPTGTTTVKLEAYDAVTTDHSVEGWGHNSPDLFTLELEGPGQRPYMLWQGQNEAWMHAILDLLRDDGGLEIKRH